MYQDQNKSVDFESKIQILRNTDTAIKENYEILIL